ncbi:MAG TPA: Hsp20/alpha crystallin family protein [Burkholderiaceae bacterium]|nr:Hsp20/alpha crystallin family protein [Burkholderiaceae bacterium]
MANLSNEHEDPSRASRAAPASRGKTESSPERATPQAQQERSAPQASASPQSSSEQGRRSEGLGMASATQAATSAFERAGREAAEMARGAGQSLYNASEAIAQESREALRAGPFAFMQQMSREMDRMFQSVFSFSPFSRSMQSMASAIPWTPPMEVLESEREITVCLDVPGVDREDIQVQLEPGLLMLRGERRNESVTQGQEGQRVERSYGSFCRTVALPRNIDIEKTQASLDNGVLRVTVPLTQFHPTRTLTIQSGQQAGSQGQQQQPGLAAQSSPVAEHNGGQFAQQEASQRRFEGGNVTH